MIEYVILVIFSLFLIQWLISQRSERAGAIFGLISTVLIILIAGSGFIYKIIFFEDTSFFNIIYFLFLSIIWLFVEIKNLRKSKKN